MFLLLRPRAELVDIVEVKLQPMRVTIDEEGKTRAREVFTISAPVQGRLLRTGLKEGDRVVANQTVVAEIEPSDSEFLDPRSQAESEALRDAAAAAREVALAELKQAKAERDFASAEVKRAHELFAKGTIPRQKVDDAERGAQATQAAVEAAMGNLKVRDYELNRARARLVPPTGSASSASPCACVTLRSPVDGRVLRILQKSETIVTPGAPLMEVGDPRDLEIVADMLSYDAVKIRPGQQVIIDGWGGDEVLLALVRVVEPFAFTKTSALGIEEQRVDVSLGHAFRVNVRVVMWQSAAVKTIPLTALFRHEGGWAVYVDNNGVANTRPVTIGHSSSLDVEVVSGLEVGEGIVQHPNDRLSDGTRIRRR
jgi:HlyD family secretion protein